MLNMTKDTKIIIGALIIGVLAYFFLGATLGKGTITQGRLPNNVEQAYNEHQIVNSAIVELQTNIDSLKTELSTTELELETKKKELEAYITIIETNGYTVDGEQLKDKSKISALSF